MQQLHLNLAIRPDARLSDFAGQGWIPIIDAVRQLHLGLLSHLYIYGAVDSGKSHLLAAICESYYDTDHTAIVVSLRQLVHSPIDILASLESFDVVLLDDIDAIAASREWQEAVFHLLNRNQSAGKQWVVAGNLPSHQLESIDFLDLRSRLAQAASFVLPQGDLVKDREIMLNAVMQRRGWRFDIQIINYLLERGPHQIGSMLKLLIQLEPMFMSRKRKLSKQEIRQAQQYIDEYVPLG